MADTPNDTLTWTDVSTGISGDLYNVFATDAGHVWVFGAEGMWRSTSNGRTFEAQALPGDARQMVAMWGVGAKLWAGGWYDVLRSTDGATWSALTVAGRTEVYAAWGSGENDVYLVGRGGAVFHSVDGRLFLTSPTGVNAALNGVWGAGASDVYAVGLFGTILHSTTSGASWTAQKAASQDDDFNGLWGSGPDDIYAVAAKRIYHRDNTMWRSSFDAPNGATLYRAWGSARGDVYVTGSDGLLFHSENDGASWNKVDVGTQRDLYGVWGSGRNDVYVVGEGGTVFHGTR